MADKRTYLVTAVETQIFEHKVEASSPDEAEKVFMEDLSNNQVQPSDTYGGEIESVVEVQ